MNADNLKLISPRASKIVRIFALMLVICMLSWRLQLNGQNVGVGTTVPHPSAKLEIKSDHHGLLIPRLSTAQRNAINNPAHSLLIFNIDNFCIEAYDSLSGSWVAVSCPISCPVCDTIQCVLPIVDSVVGPTAICPGDTVQFILYGAGGLPYWVTPNNWILLTPSDTSVFIAGSEGVLYGSLCNNCGCVYDSIIVYLDSVPSSVSITGPNNICVWDTIVLNASGSGVVSYYNWQIPTGWVIIGPPDSSSLVAIPPSVGVFTFSVQACNSCGCSPSASYTVNVDSNVLSPAVTISGPPFVCAADTAVFKAPYSGASLWQWTYPPTWQLIAQGGDSIVLAPDTSDGYVVVGVCDTTNCSCGYDTLFVVSDSCRSFCIAIGGVNYEQGNSIIQTNDGGYVITGWTASYGSGNADVYIIKLDAMGTLQWTKTIGGANEDRSFSIIQTSDGGYAIAGLTRSYGSRGADVYVIKLDATGTLQWTKTIGGSNDDYGLSIVQTSDGGYAIAGQTNSFGAGSWDVYVVKLDAAGTLQWTKAIGGTGWDESWSIVQTNDGGYAIAGWTTSYGSGGADVYVIKLDAMGTLQWTRTIGGSSDEHGWAITQTSDGGFAITGETASFGSGNYDLYIVKLDGAGSLQWTKAIGGSSSREYGLSIIHTNDGGYAIAGQTGSFGSGGGDIYVVKIDSIGTLQWAKTIGGINYDDGVSVIQTSDGGFAVVGLTRSFGTGDADVYVIKLDSNGNLPDCPGGCQVGSGGVVNSGGNIGGGGIVSSGGSVGSGGVVSSGGVLTNICP